MSQSLGYNPMPGIGPERTYINKRVLKTQEGKILLSHAGMIDGAQSRDPSNTGYVHTLQPGLLMGIITSSGKWAPAVVGALASAYSSGGTTLTVSAAVAVELDRLVGQAGTNELVCIGAPTATGTVAVTAFTHSAINTTNGQITVTSLGVDKHAGSYIAVNDGRYTPLGILDEGYGIKTTDEDGVSVANLQLGRLLIGGFVDTDQVVNYPSSTNSSLQAWVKAMKGKFVWTDDYGL